MAEEKDKQEYGSDSDKDDAAVYGSAPVTVVGPSDSAADDDFGRHAGRMYR